MRLTLRTLLAYLDDILDPVQTKEIGARISENPTVSQLVDRIREVTRRRRIGSPELSGPGSSPDPNVVAEYLDNALDPAAVADLERVCLDSDVHLAEVAACHQILTIVLGEPVTIRPELRERMYAMGAASPAPPASAVPTAVPYAVGSARPIASKPVVPDYLKRPPLWKKLLPLSALALVVAGWIYLVAGYFKEDKPNLAASAPGEKKPLEQSVKPPVEKPREAIAAAAQPADQRIAAATVPAEAKVGETPQAPADQPAVAAPAAERPTNDNAVAVVAPAAIPAPPAPGIPAPTENGAAIVPPTVMYTSSDGVLLHRPKGRPDWTMLPRRALVHVGDEIACPDPFVSDLQVSSPTDPALTLRVSLQGGTRLRLLPPTDRMLAELEVDRGRVAVYRGADGVPHALGIGVTAAGLRTEFDAVSPQTRFGLIVIRPQPKGSIPAADQWPRPSGRLYVAAGSVNVRRANLPPIAGKAIVEAMEWTDPAVDNFTPDSVPTWLDPDARPLTSQKNWSRQYEDEFQLDTPVQNSISPVAETDKRNTIALYATRTMSLIDEVPTLVRVLTSPHEDARFAAMVGLREWVMTSPDNAPRLQDEVNRVFRDQEAPIVNKLLWRISDAEAHDEASSMQLVEWLANDNIAIRDLAYYEVLDHAKRDLGYRPQNTVGQREPALMRWRELVRRNKGLVPTVAEPAAPPAQVPPSPAPST